MALLPLGAAPLPAPWQHQDIGNVGLAGSASGTGAAFEVAGGGADIWGTADAFHFAYIYAIGDCDLIARVASVGNTDAWAKAGVMVRESLLPGARAVLNAVTSQNGVEVQWRAATGGQYDYTQKPAIAAPTWLRLTRTGDVFRAYHSADGVAWTLFGLLNVPMASNVYAGLAVSAVNNLALNTSTFDSVSIRSAANGDSDGDGMPDAYEIANGLNPTDARDAAEDIDRDGMTNRDEYLAGTDLRNAASVLRILDSSPVPGGIALRFSAVPGRSYSVERSPSLLPPSWTVVTNVWAATNSVIAVTNALSGSGQTYFRIGAL